MDSKNSEFEKNSNINKENKANTNPQKGKINPKAMKKYNVTSHDAKHVRSNFEEKYKKNQKSSKIKKNIENLLEFDVKQHPATKNQKQDIDSLISNIVPNSDRKVSIEVNNLDLTFEVETEKIDTLKESFIRTIKREKSKKTKIHALNNISFKIYNGEKVGIIGYNGAGKSTLLNVITGIYPPDNGEIKTYGKISPLLSLGAGFDHNYSGRKNIMLNGAVLGYSKKFLESKMDEIIEFSELGEYIDIPIKNYSSGMLAKLGFSIATAVNPDILIVDEILGVGDVNFQKKSRDKIKYLMDSGTTVLFVSHSIPQVRDICDKAIWIDHGTMVEMGEVNEVCDHYLKDAEKASNEQLAKIQLR